jgi:hypothetical protein
MATSILDFSTFACRKSCCVRHRVCLLILLYVFAGASEGSTASVYYDLDHAKSVTQGVSRVLSWTGLPGALANSKKAAPRIIISSADFVFIWPVLDFGSLPFGGAGCRDFHLSRIITKT